MALQTALQREKSENTRRFLQEIFEVQFSPTLRITDRMIENLKERMRQFLTTSEMRTLTMRYGLDNGMHYSERYIANYLQVSNKRTHHYLNAARKKMRLHPELVNAFLKHD